MSLSKDGTTKVSDVGVAATTVAAVWLDLNLIVRQGGLEPSPGEGHRGTGDGVHGKERRDRWSAGRRRYRKDPRTRPDEVPV